MVLILVSMILVSMIVNEISLMFLLSRRVKHVHVCMNGINFFYKYQDLCVCISVCWCKSFLQISYHKHTSHVSIFL